MKPVSAAELYAHAIAIEREAAERYAEFAERMRDLGNEAAAGAFAQLAGLEAGHLEALLARTAGVALPALAAAACRTDHRMTAEEILLRRLTNKLLHARPWQ